MQPLLFRGSVGRQLEADARTLLDKKLHRVFAFLDQDRHRNQLFGLDVCPRNPGHPIQI